MIRKILAPTDLSELSLAGVRHALNKARDQGAEVTIYHVVTIDEIRRLSYRLKHQLVRAGGFSNVLEAYLELFRANLARVMEQNFGDLLPFVKTDERVELGSPDKSIVELAKTEEMDLIIMATRGRGGLSRMLLGSVTEQVIRNAPCPVVAIPPNLAGVVADRRSAA